MNNEKTDFFWLYGENNRKQEKNSRRIHVACTEQRHII